jgi:hypothetical protein
MATTPADPSLDETLIGLTVAPQDLTFHRVSAPGHAGPHGLCLGLVPFAGHPVPGLRSVHHTPAPRVSGPVQQHAPFPTPPHRLCLLGPVPPPVSAGAGPPHALPGARDLEQRQRAGRLMRRPSQPFSSPICFFFYLPFFDHMLLIDIAAMYHTLLPRSLPTTTHGLEPCQHASPAAARASRPRRSLSAS